MTDVGPMNLRRVAAVAAVLASSLAAAGILASRTTGTTHAASPSRIGTTSTGATLDALVDVPGPVTAETVAGADWEVPRSGLVNLRHPKAVAAKLADGPEPIQVFFHAIRHPRAGLFLVDTGVERAFRDDRDHALVGGLVGRVMGAEKLHVREDTASWIARQPDPVAGVFLTHLHLDHVSGLRDVPAGTPVWTGPGEGSERGFENVFVRPVTDAALEGKPELRQWRFERDSDDAFEGIVDVFGDGSVFALYVPGHTAGSTAYLARTTTGPVLFTGDACHTAWGWENGVEPGTFSSDRPRSAESLARLERFVAKHPSIDVRPGHQTIVKRAASR